MERLNFGIRAQRRARRQRLRRRAAILSLVAMAVGVPGANAGIDLVQRLLGPAPAQATAGIESTESVTGLIRFRNRAVESREAAFTGDEPTDKPTREASPTPTETVSTMEAVIIDAANEFGLDPGYLLSVADCESDFDPYAVNSVGYYGLFQFDEATWAAYGYGSIYDPTAQARTAARLIAAGQTERWPNCA